MGSINRFSTKATVLSKFSMFLLALYPLISWYDISFALPLGGTLMLFFSSMVIVAFRGRINVLHRFFWIVFLYVCFTWCYRNDFAFWTLFPPGGWVFFLFCISIVAGIITFDISLLTKYMKYAVWISILLFWIQYIIVHSTGSNICMVPNLTGKFTYEGLSYSELVARHRTSMHPCSFFLEKSYMAYYLITYLALILFSTERHEKWWHKETLVIVVTLIALRSGSGMVAMPILLLVRIFLSFWNGNKTRSILLICLTIPVFVAAYYAYVSTESGEEILFRQSELTTEGTSGYSRVVAGYVMFDSQSLNEQILGTSRNKLINDYGHNKEESMTLYINGFQTILLTFGYIGSFLYILFYGFVFRKVTIMGRMSIITLLIMSLLESNYLNVYMVLLTVIACAEYYHQRLIKLSE